MSVAAIAQKPDIAVETRRSTPRAARPLHVAMISDVYFPRINGVSTSIQTFRSALAGLGVRVTVVAPEYPPGDAAVDPATFAAQAGIVRVPSRGVPLDPEDRLMQWNVLADLDRRLASADFDLVHVQTPFAAHYAGLRLARARGIPCVATYHTHFEEYLPRESALRDCYAAADVFTFASQTETQGLVLLEAMAIGLPVLAIPALGAAEIINPARGAIPAEATVEAGVSADRDAIRL